MTMQESQKKGFLCLHDHIEDTIVWQHRGKLWRVRENARVIYILAQASIYQEMVFVLTHHLRPISIHYIARPANSRMEIFRAVVWNLPTPPAYLGKSVIFPFCWEELRTNAASEPRAWFIFVARDMHKIWLFGISALLSFFFGTIFTDESAPHASVTFATVASSGLREFWVAFQTDADCSLGCFVNLLDVGYGPLLKFRLLSTQVVAAPR